MPEHHTQDEINEAINAADMLYKRDGYLSSKTLLKELETRTGKPASYWHTIELFNAIIRARNGTRRKTEIYTITKEHERAILEAAEIIASRHPVPKLSPEDIRKYFRELPIEQRPANPAAITTASSAKINEILKAAGWTQYKTGNYITSIPPARNADEIQVRAVRILEAAEDPQSGIAEKLHDIRYRHKFRDATPEELQAAVLDEFLSTPEHRDHAEFIETYKFNRSAETAARRKAKKRARKMRPKFEPTTREAAHAYTAAINDLEKARAAAGKKPGVIEEAIYLIHKPTETKTAEPAKAEAKDSTETKTTDQPNED